MKKAVLMLTVFTSLLACSTSTKRETVERSPAFFKKEDPLDLKDILASSSSPALKASQIRVITDNDASFDSKIAAIRAARNGETVRLAYYIYARDESSAVFYKELIKAAERGVKIKLMADFITNYKHLDLFSYLQEQGRGNIQVKLYGRPSSGILRDLGFMSMPCPEVKGTVKANTCSSYKWKQLRTSKPDFYSRLMASGLYAKNGDALKTAFLKGQVIDLDSFKGDSASDEDRKQLMEFFQLYYQSRANTDILASLKVLLAMQIYGEKLNPVLNELFGRLPLSQEYDESFKEWEHLTDFNHHKILLVGERFLQLGGRNIENSYHMKPNTMTDKYIFMDTDVAVELTSGGKAIAEAFDQSWNFNAMAANLQEIRSIMPNEMVSNPEAMTASLEKCSTPVYKTVEDRQRLEKCLEKNFYAHPQYENLAARQQKIGREISEHAQAYTVAYAPKKSYTETWLPSSSYTDQLTSKDVSNVLMTYIENLHFDKNKKGSARTRTFGSYVGGESANGKYIHHLWYQGLENTCLTSAQEGREKRVILHSAYFLPSSSLLRAFSKMMDGTWNCSKVRVTFLTNSRDTTDLNIINVAAKYQLASLFYVYQGRREIFGKVAADRSAKFEYYEYMKEGWGNGLSLHTKASVLGDDVIIGSANADVRSYYMDTNNGLFLRGASDFVKSYTAYVDTLLKDARRTRNLTTHFGDHRHTAETLFAEDRVFLEELMQKYNFSKDLKPATKEKILDSIFSIVKFIHETTRKIVAQPYISASGETTDETAQMKQKEQIKLEKQFDRILQLL